MSYRALALDLDGTLLRPDDAVSERNRRAVQAAVAAGWHVILSTARWHQQAERTADDLGLLDPVIACSGAEVRRRDGTDLFDERLPAGFAAGLYERCDRAGATALIVRDRDVVLRTERAPASAQLPEITRVGTLAGLDGSPRCALVFGDAVIADVRAALAPRWGDDVRFLVSHGRGGAAVLTLTGARADKGVALRVACDDLGITVADVVAMGDSETDVEMFRVAGAGVAMGQSPAEVRDAATWVTDTCADDGVAVAIERLLDERWRSAGS
jgi:hypothetical protein